MTHENLSDHPWNKNLNPCLTRVTPSSFQTLLHPTLRSEWIRHLPKCRSLSFNNLISIVDHDAAIAAVTAPTADGRQSLLHCTMNTHAVFMEIYKNTSNSCSSVIAHNVELPLLSVVMCAIKVCHVCDKSFISFHFESFCVQQKTDIRDAWKFKHQWILFWIPSRQKSGYELRNLLVLFLFAMFGMIKIFNGHPDSER